MTTELERIPRHFGEALVSLVPPFWGKPRIAALLRSYINRVQEIEDAAWEVLQAFDVNTCDETRLKVLAKIVGVSNFGWDLETFRAVVRARIATNRSHGTEDDILRVLRLITGTAAPITVYPLVPATIAVDMGEPVSDEHMVAIAFLLPQARGAGIRLNFVAPTEGGWIFDDAVAGLDAANTFDNSVTPITGAGTFGAAITL
jgi:hypothetical protein